MQSSTFPLRSMEYEGVLARFELGHLRHHYPKHLRLAYGASLMTPWDDAKLVYSFC